MHTKHFSFNILGKLFSLFSKSGSKTEREKETPWKQKAGSDELCGSHTDLWVPRHPHHVSGTQFNPHPPTDSVPRALLADAKVPTEEQAFECGMKDSGSVGTILSDNTKSGQVQKRTGQ